MSDILPDMLAHDVIVVFCGTAASTKSAEVGAYYGNPTNAFWRTLYETGMTPHQLQPTDFKTLKDFAIGLTDVAKGAVGNDDVLSNDDFDRDSLTQKIELYQPEILAFTSKRAYRAWRGVSSSKAVQYGWQAEGIGETRIYVLTSPSGAARGYWDIAVWQTLADTYTELRTTHGDND